MRGVILVVLRVAAPAVAHAQCFPVTKSGKAFFSRALTAQEHCAARLLAKRRGCSAATVHENTPGAIDGAKAKQFLPYIRDELAETARTCRPAARVPAKSRRAERRKPAPAPIAIPIPVTRPVLPPTTAVDAPRVVPATAPPAPIAAPLEPPRAKPNGFLAWLLGWLRERW
jgi:hypothetical protein